MEVTQQLDRLTSEVRTWATTTSHGNDLLEMARLAVEQDDPSFLADIDLDADRLAQALQDYITGQILNGTHDDQPAIITIQSGAGGAEASLWAEMLLGMYTAWATREHRTSLLMDTTYADRGGLRSATLEIMGPKPYGHLKGEDGVHRLVRMSPLDPAGRRHTSFCRVEVLPAVPKQDTTNTPPPYDIRFDAFHASGPGGQHVHKVASAVRLVHLPTPESP